MKLTPLLIFLTLFVSHTISAQLSQSYSNPLELNHQYGIYYFTANEHFIHFQTSLYQTAQPLANSNDYFSNTKPFSGLHQIAMQLEANRKVSPNFHLGIVPQINFRNDNTTYSLRPNITHNGNLYKLQFLKTFGLSLSKQVFEKNSNPYISTVPITLATFDLGLALAYKIPFPKLPLRLMLSYKVFFIKEFTDDDAKIYDKRYVDFDQLKLSIQTLLARKVNISLWGAFQNQYLLALANNISQEKNIRFNTPMIGWEIKYFLGVPNQKNNYSFIF